MVAMYTVEPCTAPPCSSAAPLSRPLTLLSRPLMMSDELERLSRRDDALAAVLVAYGVVVAISMIAYCLDKTLRGGTGCSKISKQPPTGDLP